jgi:salicylate hydroxylase
VFNAILIIASHVVDPEFRDDREALSHLEQGMYMIRQMSANHTSAQRAHVFLRQLLDLVEKTLPVHIRKIAGPGESESHRGSSVSAADSLPPDLGYDGPASREFMQFWDNTEDLTMALGSQLESYSTLGNGMWSWGYGATSDARMYAVPPQTTGIVP